MLKDNNINPSMFEFIHEDKNITDSKVEMKRIGYFKDALIRFYHNKASVIAFIIIVFLLLFAILVPITSKTTYTETRNDLNTKYYSELLPKVFEAGVGFWDGTRVDEIKEDKYNKYIAIGIETGRSPIVEVKDEYKFQNIKYYKAQIDYYAKLGIYTMTLTKE